MSVIAAFAAGLIIMLVIVFGVGALAINLYTSTKSPSPVVPEDLQKEDHLENANPADLITHSPRADDLERRTDELADTVRKRIRDRARQTLSGESGPETHDRS